MGTLTMKFGGASVSTTSALTQVVGITLQQHEHWDRLIIVVSALEGVTDALIEATHLAQLSNRRGYRRIVATLRTRHLALVDKLPLGTTERNALRADIDKLLFDMLDICQAIADPMVESLEPEMLDSVIGVGEKIAARIVAAMLRENNLRGVAIDTPEIIITNHDFGGAIPHMEETNRRIQRDLLPMIEREIIPVVTGFIGGTLDGKPTTLGRGGSDYTAAILSVCTDADEIWMWTDVDGMMSTDPREIQEARVIPELSYDEVSEMAYFGARIVHPRMIDPLRERKIPVYIKNIFKPQQPGTLIGGKRLRATNRRIKAVTTIHGIGLRAGVNGPIDEISMFVRANLQENISLPADVMFSSQSSRETLLCFVIPTIAGPDAVHTAQTALSDSLQKEKELTHWEVTPVSVLTVIGTDLDLYPHTTALIFQALDNIPILALSQGPSHCSLSIVVKPEHTESALKRIHPLTIQD